MCSSTTLLFLHAICFGFPQLVLGRNRSAQKVEFFVMHKKGPKNGSADFEAMRHDNQSESNGVRYMTGESLVCSVSVDVSGICMCFR
jgi:hypothetical protein